MIWFFTSKNIIHCSSKYIPIDSGIPQFSRSTAQEDNEWADSCGSGLITETEHWMLATWMHKCIQIHKLCQIDVELFAYIVWHCCYGSTKTFWFCSASKLLHPQATLSTWSAAEEECQTSPLGCVGEPMHRPFADMFWSNSFLCNEVSVCNVQQYIVMLSDIYIYT